MPINPNHKKPYLLPNTWANIADTLDPTSPEYQDIIEQPPQSKIDEGWVFGEKPSHKWWNWNWKEVDDYIHHVNSMGVPLWDDQTTYQIGSIALVSPYLWKATAENQNEKPGTGTSWEMLGAFMEDLTDVDPLNPSDSSPHILQYNSGNWELIKYSDIIPLIGLQNLRDTNIANKAVDDVFVSTGEKWENKTASEAMRYDDASDFTDVRNIQNDTHREKDVIKYDGYIWKTDKNVHPTIGWDKVLNHPNEYQPPMATANTFGGARIFRVGVTLFIYTEPNSVPGAPQKLQSNSSRTKVELFWLPAEDGGGSYYHNIYKNNERIDAGILDNLYDDTDVEPDREYVYYVTSVNQHGESAPSNEVVGHTFIQPSRPLSLSAEVVGDRVVLNWQAPEIVSGNISYEIFRDGVSIDVSYATTYTDENLTGGVYTYYVVAKNKYFTSENSNEVAVSV
jgi:hypothetical protein